MEPSPTQTSSTGDAADECIKLAPRRSEGDALRMAMFAEEPVSPFADLGMNSGGLFCSFISNSDGVFYWWIQLDDGGVLEFQEDQRGGIVRLP